MRAMLAYKGRWSSKIREAYRLLPSRRQKKGKSTGRSDENRCGVQQSSFKSYREARKQQGSGNKLVSRTLLVVRSLLGRDRCRSRGAEGEAFDLCRASKGGPKGVIEALLDRSVRLHVLAIRNGSRNFIAS